MAVCFGFTFAQTNLDLEAWSSNGFGGEDPDGWGTLNGFMALGAPQSTWKETTDPGEALASAKLESLHFPGATTFGAPSDTVGAMLSIGGPPGFGPLGIAYTQKPVSVDFIYKANPLGNDMGVLVVELTHWDGSQTITDGQGVMMFGTQVTSWTSASICITYMTGDTPDTLKIMAASSALMLGILPRGLEMPGSQLFLDDFAINLPGALTASITGLTNVDCNGDCDGTISVAASGTPGYTYSWTNGDNTDTADSLCAGMYSVFITDGNGDKACLTAPISEPTVISTTMGSADETSAGANDGSASVSAGGGTGTLTYSWSPGGATTDSVSGLTPGMYTVTVTDSNNCSVMDSVVVNSANSAPTATDDMATTDSLVSVTTDVVGNDSDPDSDPLTVTILTQPANGTASVVGDSIMYTPNAGFVGMDTVWYQICDDGSPALCDSAMLVITVNSVVGIENLTFSSTFILYPNPVSSGILNIEMSFAGEATFVIFDMIGKQIKGVTLKDYLNQVNVSSLSNGTYMYQVTDKLGAVLANGNFTVIK